MKNKIGILALGQCGGNIGSLFEANGYNCLFINTSAEDLSTLQNVKFRYKIQEAEGCNHDRNKAVQYIQKYYREIIEQIEDKLRDQSLIYFCFGAGGGTGSGFAPILLEMCNSIFPDKHFGCICVLPSDNEAPQVQLNAYECYKAISKIEKLASVFTLDNNKQRDKLRINQSFFNKFNQILDIPKHTSIKSNIDKAEIFKMLTTRGNIYISNCPYTAGFDLTASIINSWEESECFADIEKDKQIKYLGLSITHDVNIHMLQRYIGTPLDIFQNYHPTTNITILSGLSFPKKRIEAIVERIRVHKDIIKRNLNNPIDSITTELDFLEDIKPTLETPKVDTRTLDEILKQYAS